MKMLTSLRQEKIFAVANRASAVDKNGYVIEKILGKNFDNFEKN